MAQKKLTTVGAEIDPRSDALLLQYTGKAPSPWHVPARDLHGGDLARIAHLRGLAANDGQATPPPASAEELAAIHAELLATGAFEPWDPRAAAAEPDSAFDEGLTPMDEDQPGAAPGDPATDPDPPTPEPGTPAVAPEAQE